MEDANPHMRLNDWYRMFQTIYYRTQNVERDQFRVFTHVIEVTGGFLKTYASEDNADAEKWLAKIFAWYFALAKAAGIDDQLEKVIWEKFPSLCPYCKEDQCICDPVHPPIDSEFVRKMGSQRQNQVPGTLDSWQQMFDSIYRQTTPPDGVSSDLWLQLAFIHLVEELGELGEALRLYPFYPHHLRNELADVFARLCGVVNALTPPSPSLEPVRLSDILWRHYPNRCGTCGQEVCICRPEPVREFISQSGVFEGPEFDPVTSVYNHTRLHFEFVKLRKRFPREGLGVIMIDVDNFKHFNDDTPGGHAQGDKVLFSVASTVAAELGSEGALYRRGGDEFVALLPGVTAQHVEVLACRLLDAVKALRVPDITSPHVTPYEVSVSMGVDHYPTKKAFAGAQHDLADKAMYQAKKTGKARVSRSDGAVIDCANI
jgi:diguanylate cyclase (GGDEF)-like protein